MAVCLVYGSINIDEIFRVPHIVRPGETLHSISYERRIGGKGCNQAIALAKAGGTVIFGGMIGKDSEKEIILQDGLFPQNQIDSSHVKVHDSVMTGRAVIQVSEIDGENCIVLLRGCNELVNPSPPLNGISHILLQNEIAPLDLVVGNIAKTNSKPILIVNPAPAPSIEVLKRIDWTAIDFLILNETEAEQTALALNTNANVKDLAKVLPPSVKCIIITLGSKGAMAIMNNTEIHVPAYPVQQVLDTTGAGDCFVGYFVAGLMQNSNLSLEILEEILKTASKASGITVSRPGCLESYPSIDDLS